MVEPVPESIHFPSEEEQVLKFWKERDCFQECLKQSKNRPRYDLFEKLLFVLGDKLCVSQHSSEHFSNWSVE